MIPAGLATYADNELERLAIQDLRRRPDVEHSAPTNLEILIEGLSDVALAIEDGLAAKHRVEGMVLKSGGSDRHLTVLVDTTIFRGPWNRYTAVLGEEYAHLRIHQALFLCVETVDDFVKLQRDPQWARHEADARRFSDAIRMPADIMAAECKTAYGRIASEHGFSDTMAAYNLLRSKLADKFKVTTEDVLRRIQQPQVSLEDRVLNSLQSRSSTLLPADCTVVPSPAGNQSLLFDPHS